MSKFIAIISLLFLTGCGEGFDAAWTRHGEVSNENGWLCAKAHPDWDYSQCLALYRAAVAKQ